MRLILNSIIGVMCCGSISAEVIGILGGGNDPVSGGGNVFLVDQTGGATQIVVPSLGNLIYINGVAINNSALSIIAGNYGTFLSNYAALVTESGQVMPYSNNGQNLWRYHGAAINSQGNSTAVGGNGSPAVTISDNTGNAGGPGVFACSCSIGNSGELISAAMNSANWVLAGGNAGPSTNTGILVVSVSPGSTTANQLICNIPGAGSSIFSVGLNDAGKGIAGGILNNNAYTSVFNVVDFTSPTEVVFPFATGGEILGVSINDSGTCLVGGYDNNLAAYATLIQPSGQLAAPLSGDALPTSGQINSVDLTDGFGYGIIAGNDAFNGAYAAYVDALGVVHQISGLPTGPNANIASVSMNDWGFALLGGTADGTTAYAALVNPFGGVTPLDVSGPPVQSVSIRSFLPVPNFTIPHLTGNNLIFAKYILQNAPKKALYFSPSLFKGTLADALESAAPTRNAASVYAADNNYFFLNAGISSHLRHQRQLRYHPFIAEMHAVACEEDDFYDDWEDEEIAGNSYATANDDWEDNEIDDDFYEEDGLLSMSDDDGSDSWLALQQQPSINQAVQEQAPRQSKRPYTLWGDIIGAWAAQKSQHQTVAFDPTTGGFVVACEKSFHKKNQVGLGFSYMFTHIHEHDDAGFSNINQECLFVYGTWSFGRFYLDAALSGGLFQTHQERKIHMTGFDFHSTSSPSGGQLDPHIEVGYTWIKKPRQSAWIFLFDPFAIVDWVNTWQGSYKEKGKGPFNAGQHAHYSSFLRIETGLRFYQGIKFDSWVLGLEEKGSYVFKDPFSVGKVKAYLVGSPGSFTVETLTSEQNLGVFQVGMLFNSINRIYPYGSIAYQGEFSEAYRSQQLTLEICWDF